MTESESEVQLVDIVKFKMVNLNGADEIKNWLIDRIGFNSPRNSRKEIQQFLDKRMQYMPERVKWVFIVFN